VSFPGTLNRIALQTLERLAPRSFWKWRVKRWKIDTGEKEEILLPWLCSRSKLSIDIGAADGAYAANLLQHSSFVAAFEPRMDAANNLRSHFANSRLVSVEQVALSNASGVVKMRVPSRGTSSTIDTNNSLENFSEVATIDVVSRRLDDYQFSPVGFVKIDVEGHEKAVLEGSRDTLKRERPIVLIEAEERHNAGTVAAVIQFFEHMDYSGFFFLDNKLQDVKQFAIAEHQNQNNLDDDSRRVGTYINNFVFVPKESLERIPQPFRSV
jgi:FkbM family methyltransferase